MSNNIETLEVFMPAKHIEHPINVLPDYSKSDRIRMAVRRYLKTGSFTKPIELEASGVGPAIQITEMKFLSREMGYNVIAKITWR